MNGSELLTKFLEEMEKTKPERFYGCSFHDDDPYRQRYPDNSWQIEVVREACYRAYDAVLFRRRNGEVKEIIPVEIKGDTDVLDDGRLRTQIWVHLKNFGKSLLIVDAEQAFKIKKLKLDKMLPCEIWAYNNVTFYELADSIFKYHNHGEPDISKRAIEKAFDVHDSAKLKELQIKCRRISGILATLAANQWRFDAERKFTNREAELAHELFGLPMLPTACQPLAEKDCSNLKSTGFSPTLIQKTLLES